MILSHFPALRSQVYYNCVMFNEVHFLCYDHYSIKGRVSNLECGTKRPQDSILSSFLTSGMPTSNSFLSAKVHNGKNDHSPTCGGKIYTMHICMHRKPWSIQNTNECFHLRGVGMPLLSFKLTNLKQAYNLYQTKES